MRNPERQATQEAKIKNEYATLVALKKYSRAYMLQQVADKFFLAVSTIECVIYGGYDARRKRQAARAQSPANP